MFDSSSTSKYHGEQDPSRYGGNMQWPGVNGFPIQATNPLLLKPHELERLPLVGQFYHRTFDLNDPEQAEYYNWVQDRIGNHLFVKKRELVRWPDDKILPIIYLEWMQYYVKPPPMQDLSNVPSSRFTLRSPASER